MTLVTSAHHGAWGTRRRRSRRSTCSQGPVDSARGHDFLKAFQQELTAYEGADAARDFIAYSADRLG
jgi:hypothetical protein